MITLNNWAELVLFLIVADLAQLLLASMCLAVFGLIYRKLVPAE